MAAKEKHIELSEKQRALLQQSMANTQKLRIDYENAQARLNIQANAEQLLLESICEAKGIEPVEGIQFDGQKLIIPAPKK